MYGDVIQIDQVESYYYSSVKLVMMLRWISEYCVSRNAQLSAGDSKTYVLFVTDDSFIDIEALLIYLKKIDADPDLTTIERRTFLTGKVIDKTRPERFVNDRYSISLAEYPFDRYPPYLSPHCFLMSKYNARLLYLLSKYVRLFPFEHIYLSLLTSSSLIQVIENNALFAGKPFARANQTKLVSKMKEFFRQDLSGNVTFPPICYSAHPTDRFLQLWNEIHHTNLTISSFEH